MYSVRFALQDLACSRLRDGGGKSFNKSCAFYFRFVRFNTFPLYYLTAWHRLCGAQLLKGRLALTQG